jgi:hypothetical protein
MGFIRQFSSEGVHAICKPEDQGPGYRQLGNHQNSILVDATIDPAIYRSPLIPSRPSGWRRFFSHAAETRMESKLRNEYTKGDNKWESCIIFFKRRHDRTTEKQYLFAIQKHDGAWDLFESAHTQKDYTRREDRVGLIPPGPDRYESEMSLVITKMESDLSPERVLKVFERFDQYTTKMEEAAAAARTEAARQQAARNEAAARQQTYRQSFFG